MRVETKEREEGKGCYYKAKPRVVGRCKGKVRGGYWGRGKGNGGAEHRELG